MQIVFNQREFKVEEKHLSIDLVKPNPQQPRKLFTEKSLQELEESIIQNGGILEPILAEFVNENLYMLIDGERRYRTAIKLGYKSIPARIIQEKLNEETRYMIWYCIHTKQRSWTVLEKEQMVVDAAQSLGVQKTSEIFGITEGEIEKTFKTVEIAKKITRRQPLHYAKEILNLPKDVKETLFDLIIHKINNGKIHNSKDIRQIKRIMWHPKAKEIFLQVDSDISDSIIYVYLRDFREKLMMNKPEKEFVDYDGIVQLEYMLSKLLGEK